MNFAFLHFLPFLHFLHWRPLLNFLYFLHFVGTYSLCTKTIESVHVLRTHAVKPQTGSVCFKIPYFAKGGLKNSPWIPMPGNISFSIRIIIIIIIIVIIIIFIRSNISVAAPYGSGPKTASNNWQRMCQNPLLCQGRFVEFPLDSHARKYFPPAPESSLPCHPLSIDFGHIQHVPCLLRV